MNIQNQFPFFKLNKNLIYVDNAATTQKPKIVIDEIKEFYEKYNSNINRSSFDLSVSNSIKFENSRKIISNFINASHDEIIFTSGATNSINKLVSSLKKNFNKGDEILIDISSHHAIIVPFLKLKEEIGIKINYINLTKDFFFDIDDFKSKINIKTKMVCLPHVSNVIGNINDLEKITKIAHNNNVLVLVDSTASAPHGLVDVKKQDFDFCVFSAHKMFGPLGVGILYGKKDLLEKLEPFEYGGDMIDIVKMDSFTYKNIPHKFETGTQNISGVIGFSKAIEFIESIGKENIKIIEKELLGYFFEKIKDLSFIEIIGTKKLENRVPIISFNISQIHSHDVSDIFNKYNIAIRAGHHCCMPFHNEYLKISSSNRISLSIYNTKKEIDEIIKVLKILPELYKSGDFLLYNNNVN